MNSGAEAPKSGAARRSEIRLPVRLLGTLAPAEGNAACVEVRDLSRGGACCRVPAPQPVGSRVELRLEGLAAQAVVCWAARGRLGLRFLTPLRASDILIQSSRSRSTEGAVHSLHDTAPRALPRAS